MHRHIRRAVTFIIIIMLSLSVKAWAATATGWVSIDNPADGYGASQNFFVNMSYTVTQDDNFCPNGIFQNWATFLVKLDGSIIYSIVFDSCCGVSPFGSVVPYRAYINISGLDPSKLHTVTAYLEDQVYVSGSGCRTGAIFAQDTITFRICSEDKDNDGIIACEDCDDADPKIGSPILDGDGDGYLWCHDCSMTDQYDDDATIHLYATDVCDGKDNDCDGEIDEDGGPCCNDPCCGNQCCGGGAGSGGAGGGGGGGNGSGNNGDAYAGDS